jgi:guanylate cyclase soluble subunit beta
VQGYTKLLKCLGSNLAEFLQNLNDLHLHLSMSYNAMKAPAFRCDNVSVILHRITWSVPHRHRDA